MKSYQDDVLVIISGYFNPLHKGHLEYMQNAKKLGDALYVIVNNDMQRELKGSKEFMDEDERLLILQSIKYVDKAFLSMDTDYSVRETVRFIVETYGHDFGKIIFANGGDQNNDTIKEKELCEQLGVTLIDGLGNKIQSSSWLLKNT
jgi:D-beta-D-heptose 7-phosphate kinase/D-beta-D-heptose 1-phosphate adenosyltransferase